MATNIIRYRGPDEVIAWGVVTGSGISPLANTYTTTADLINHGEADWRMALAQPASLRMNQVIPLSPITAPCRIICQGANYRQHMIESGLNPDEKTFNIFFQKSDASINGPVEPVNIPDNVRLLDYEVELGLVFKRAIHGPITLTNETLPDYVIGAVIGNDLSARDIQLPQGQWFKGKSYRGFCPLGPYIAIFEPGDFTYLDALTLTLLVNNQIRQLDETRNLVFKPVESINELSTFSDVDPGDVLLTGTPSGCALRAPSPGRRRVLQFLFSESRLWKIFVSTQSKRTQYLKSGDVVTAMIASADRVIDLGQQETRII